MMENNLIEIFILTYNRKDFLKQSLNSILNQTVKELNITIVDNASNDGTEEFVKSIANENQNIHYYKQKTNVGPANNFKTAVQLAKSKYALMFHDDDILHPDYIKTAIKLINEIKDIDLICTKENIFCDISEIKNTNPEKIECRIYKNKQDFTSHVYINKLETHLVFPGVIYKTENLKNSIENYNDLYTTAIGDIPLVISTLQDGKCAYINYPMLNYRNHQNQDSKIKKLYTKDLIDRNLFFKNELNKNLYTKLIFNIHSYYWFRGLYKFYGCYEDITLKELLRKAFRENAVSLYSYLISTSFGIILKPINSLLKKIFQKVQFKRKTVILRDGV